MKGLLSVDLGSSSVTDLLDLVCIPFPVYCRELKVYVQNANDTGKRRKKSKKDGKLK